MARPRARYAFPSLQILNLLAELFHRSLQLQTDVSELHIRRFGAKRIDLAIELLTEEVKPAANGTAVREQGACGLQMNLNAVQLFTHIRPAHEQGCSLSQSLLRQGGRGLKQFLHQFAQPLLNGAGLHRCRSSCRLHRSLDLVQMVMEGNRKPSALVGTHLHKALKRAIKV